MKAVHPIQTAVFFPAAKKLGVVKRKAAYTDFSTGQIKCGVSHIQAAEGKDRGRVFLILQAKVLSREAKTGKDDLGGSLSLAKSKTAAQ